MRMGRDLPIAGAIIFGALLFVQVLVSVLETTLR